MFYILYLKVLYMLYIQDDILHMILLIKSNYQHKYKEFLQLDITSLFLVYMLNYIHHQKSYYRHHIPQQLP
jgi:hypothetical protein